MAEKSWHLVSYNVRDPKRLRKVAKKPEGYGERLQYSVFRCRLDHTAIEKLCWELTEIMKSEDDLLVMPICAGVPNVFLFTRRATNQRGLKRLRHFGSYNRPQQSRTQAWCRFSHAQGP